MSHYGDVLGDEGFDLGRYIAPPFEFNHFSASRNQLSRIFYCLFRRFVRPIGQIRHQQRTHDSAPHCARVVEHISHCHLLRAFISQYIDANRVSHKNDIDTRSILKNSRGMVVTGQHRNGFASLFHQREGFWFYPRSHRSSPPRVVSFHVRWSIITGSGRRRFNLCQ